jgi:hypothetical protein
VGAGLQVRHHRRRWTLKIQHAVEEFTRGSVADLVAYPIDADVTVNMPDEVALTANSSAATAAQK